LPAAADDELEELAEDVEEPEAAPLEVADAAPADPEEPEEPEPELPDAIPADAPVVTDALEPAPMTSVVEVPTLTVNHDREALPLTAMDVTPTGRPAGIVATSGWLVMTDGCEVTPAGRLDCAVTRGGRPVTTPRELVSVR